MRLPALAPLAALLAAACSPTDGSGGDGAPHPLPLPEVDVARAERPGEAKVVLAGGCFWCTEAALEQIVGVTDVVSGYAGGTAANAVYEIVGAGETDHAEAIEVTYDPSVRTLGELLRVFFTAHDPTEKDRQGPDVGRQYRSAIFFADDEQRRIAAAYVEQLDAASVFDRAIATTLEPLDRFFPAEAYHQDFARLHPRHGYVRAWSIPKAEKVRNAYPEWVAAGAGSDDG
ncbi:MAG: peptide-methionine (S)-S-oxide reductase MsrA [Planctomycetota bacterium JB042]